MFDSFDKSVENPKIDVHILQSMFCNLHIEKLDEYDYEESYFFSVS